MIKLVINTANAAFADGDKNAEIARIIDDAARAIENGRFDVSGLRKRIIQLSDVNGNKVGTLLESDEPTPLNYGEDARIVLDMETGNAAFEGEGKGYECARILHEAAGKIRGGDLSFKLRDVNGNTVGKVEEVGGVALIPSIKTFDNWQNIPDSQVVYEAENADTPYSKADFIRLCEGDIANAYHLFYLCEGQCPETLIDERGGLSEMFEEDVDIDAVDNVETSFEDRLADIQAEWENAVGESDESRNFTDWLSTEHPRIAPVQYCTSTEGGFITSPAMLDLETGEVAGMDIPGFDEVDTPVINNEFIKTLEENDRPCQASVELLPDDSTRVTSKDELANLQTHFEYVPVRGRLTLDTMRPDVKGKLIVENAVSLDDDELNRVFSGVVLEGFCVRVAQRARAGGVTMDDIRAEHEKQKPAQTQSRYAVKLVLETGKKVDFFDFADDAKHAEGLAIAAQPEQVFEIVSTKEASVYDELKAAGVPMDNHESDLYVPVTAETTAILANYPLNKTNATTFKSNTDGVRTYDIPFAYSPFWEMKASAGSLFEANRIAREKDSHVMADPAVDQNYDGKVLGVTAKHVVLSLGRTALIVAQADLDRVPAQDEAVVVKFKDGKGVVEPTKGKEVDQGR